MSCNSICRKNKTEKGYLCDNPKKSKISSKKWCYINNIDVKNYGKFLTKPRKSGAYYWDYIAEENRPQSMCLSNDKIKYNLSCSYLDTFKYLLGGLILTSILPTAYGGFKHLKQTILLAGKPNKQILLYLIAKLNRLIQTEVDKGNISQEILDETIASLKYDLENIDPTDSEGYGKFLKSILSDASSIIKTNEKHNSRLYPTSLIDFFVDKIPDEYAMEIIKGANFMVRDGGELYEWVKTNIHSGYGRFSSHKSIGIQYGFTDMFVDTYLHMLCGSVKNENGEILSWCQFEGAPMPAGLTTKEVFSNMWNGSNIDREKLQQYVDHFLDSGFYFTLSKTAQLWNKKGFNLALGTSQHTDTNPLYIVTPPHTYENSQSPTSTPTSTSFSYLKNNFTYELGIHSDMSALYNDVTGNAVETISSGEYEREKLIGDSSQLNVVGQGAYIGQNNTQQHMITQPNLQTLIGMGGKNKKTKRKRRNKRKTRKYILYYKKKLKGL